MTVTGGLGWDKGSMVVSVMFGVMGYSVDGRSLDRLVWLSWCNTTSPRFRSVVILL